MRRSLIITLLVMITVLACAPEVCKRFGNFKALAANWTETVIWASLPAEAQDERREPQRDLPEREETRQSYQLAPGASVELATISGAVDVETTTGNTAEVHIINSARDRNDLACHRFAIEHTPARLAIKQESTPRRCYNVPTRQRLMLKVPRDVNFEARAISGDVRIGEIDGHLRLRGLSGDIEVAQASGYSELSGLSGNVTITVGRLGERGLRVSGTSGPVELRLADELNADIQVSGLSGDLTVENANVVLSRVGSSSFRGRIGTGGVPISVTGASGTITISRSSGR